MCRKFIRSFRESYSHFMEGKGFALLVTLCIAVIAGTAVWTKSEPPYAAPTPPVSADRSAASLMQQHLPSSATPTPLPSSQPVLWRAPLDMLTVANPYSATAMSRSEHTGIWQVHQAVDLSGSTGDRVFSIADGVVSSTGNDILNGIWIEIEHQNGYRSLYAGLSALAAFQSGDRVRAGQPIGFVGNSIVNEAHLGPHLHLSICKDDQPVDPLTIIGIPE